MPEAIGNPLLDKFIKDLIIQILALITEQGRTKLYSADIKDPLCCLVYRSIVQDLENGVAI
ncbi:hypothetical protein ECA02_34210 [Enterococcus casseliflavus]|nr:hypothetical protein ECA02_34210 [Enterococcus casseliflavus]